MSKSAVLPATKLKVSLPMLEQSGSLVKAVINSDLNSGQDWCTTYSITVTNQVNH